MLQSRVLMIGIDKIQSLQQEMWVSLGQRHSHIYINSKLQLTSTYSIMAYE